MTTTSPVRALIIVDIQPTFCEGGELPVTGGHQVAADTATYLRANRNSYKVIVTTQDHHIEPGDHFSTTPNFVESWPPHGVAGTLNAEVHPELTAALTETGGVDVTITKGEYAAAYSGFDGTDAAGANLTATLTSAGVTDVDVCGLAESHCVQATVLDAVAAGFGVRLLSDLTAPVTKELGVVARKRMRDAGAAALLSTEAFPQAADTAAREALR